MLRVTDDGITWSYEIAKAAESTSTKLKTAVYMSKVDIGKLPVSVRGPVDRASILSQINACADVKA